MPEYLAPGVYVEEVDTGSKPIEGVSTSTAGMIGVTERGPVNVPILITSYGEYLRWFGERLRIDLYSNGTDRHCYLPHAAEGFFTNGGKRVFIVRILDTANAVAATMRLFDRNAAAGASTFLIQPFMVAPPANVIYVASATGLAVTVPPTWVQIGDGASSEFRRISAVPARSDISLRMGLSFTHGSPTGIDHFAAAPAVADSPTLVNAANPSDRQIRISGPGAVAAGTVIRLGAAGTDDEYVIADAAPVAAAPNPRDVILRTPVLLLHPNGGPTVDILAAFPAPATPADSTTFAGSAVDADVLLVANRTNFVTAGEFVRINDGNNTEIRRVGQLSSIVLPASAYGDYPAGSVVEVINEAVDGAPPRTLTSPVDPNVGNVIDLDNRSGLNVGDVLRIGAVADPTREFATIGGLPGPQLGLTNPGRVVLTTSLRNTKLPGDPAARLTAPITRAGQNPTSLATPTARNTGTLIVGGGNGIVGPAVLRITTSAGAFFHLIAANPAAINPTPLTVDAPLTLPHGSGEPVVARLPLITVQAIDQGDWGNRLRVAVRDSDPPLCRSQIRGIPPDGTHLRLDSTNGVEAGTILLRVDANGNLLSSHKVVGIDRASDNLIAVDPATPLVGAMNGDRVRSQEFQIDVYLMRQPDPSVPTRSDPILIENFMQLSMDPRHSRYIHKVIGTTWSFAAGTTADDDGNPLRKSDHRSEGASWLIRVRDEETVAANRLLIRFGPTPIFETPPNRPPRPARLPLSQGNDAIASIQDATYIGTPNIEPELRTGLYALQNEEDISIIGAPGRIRPQLQTALIAHCEELRYRFAVLDGPQPPNDSLNDAQSQRQNFDSKYAAFYHPWLVIPDPFPLNLANIPNYPIPPSGHMLGIYARTDIERGVHKAPANEVVRGITGLQRKLNKGEHDILNPYPVNINVIRDFRENSRGIRVYGGRVITSDPDWKYVNVRRLLIFIEASIDRGLQWVVFEPNAEPLWARVRRSISNFLNLVWRNGALEGTEPEAA
jgi:phage tail sheath protein FI